MDIVFSNIILIAAGNVNVGDVVNHCHSITSLALSWTAAVLVFTLSLFVLGPHEKPGGPSKNSMFTCI